MDEEAIINRDTPLRLERAAAIAFPGGGMSASSLRKERDRGRLATEHIAGKEFVTLAAIDEMRRLCRREARGPNSGSVLHGETKNQSGSSETDRGELALAAAHMTLSALKHGSPLTSSPSINRRESAVVTQLKSKSRM